MIRGLAGELRADIASARLPAGLSTGLVVAVLMLVFAPALAATVFAGPLTAFVPRGTGVMLFGTVALCLIAGLTGTYKGTLSVPNFAPAAALVTIGSAVGASMSSASGAALFATMVMIVALSTLTTALCFLLIGCVRTGCGVTSSSATPPPWAIVSDRPSKPIRDRYACCWISPPSPGSMFRRRMSFADSSGQRTPEERALC